jgi:hypothetical protein
VCGATYLLQQPGFPGLLDKAKCVPFFELLVAKLIHILVGMWLKEWRRRYFILKGNKLFFSKGSTVRHSTFLTMNSRSLPY